MSRPDADKEEDRRIGNLIRILRIKAKISQAELGEALGVTFQQVQKYEKGANRIGSGKLARLAEALGVQPHQFFSPSDNSSAADEWLQLLANSRNQRALRAFANLRSPKLKDAFLDVLERASDQP